ncbi:hypothetical protein F53441_8464 [Fusarium austroafricanum]|uniref:Uncharacterized protein n=1 Tax=Fusarium austroafricanum TaxID=2364996 RepID=A0A8H4KBA8_9HYPO|nr:hypothetical protein F53441_8464 [Fusarium austroafricanum]
MGFTLPLYWFIHPAYPNFTICSRCYHDHILNSAFRDTFNPVWHEDRVERRCFIGNPRVKESLWPVALSASSLDTMLNFMATRPALGHCPEDKSSEGNEWYYPPDRPEMAICKPCYEDYFKHTRFGNKFSLYTPSGESTCDHNLWYIRRMLKVHSATGNWIAFTTGFSKRLQLHPCPKAQAIAGPERTWFWSSRVPSGFLICEACYWDYFHDSPESQSFQATRMGPAQQATCSMSQANILIPMVRAVSYGDFPMFWHTLQAVSQQQTCNPQGARGITWYTLPNDPPEFDICGACMAGTIGSMRMTHLFKPKQVNPSEARLCSFNLYGYPRATVFLQRFAESAYINDWRPLSDMVTDLSAAPPCPKIDRDLAKNRRWWGWDDVHICQECYILVAKKTRLEKHFTMKGDHVAESRLCDLYSSRMRQLYKETCQTQQLASFLAFAQQRRQIYLQTVPEMNQMLANAKHALSQAQTLGLAAVTFSAAGNLNSTNFNYVGYGYGNAQLAQAAMADQQMQQVGAAAAGPAAIARVGKLLEAFITEALQPPRVAAYILNCCLPSDYHEAVLRDIASNWIFIVEISKYGTTSPAPTSSGQADIIRRDGNKCCITGKPAGLGDALIIVPVVPAPTRWLNAQFRVDHCPRGTLQPPIEIDGQYALFGDHSRFGIPPVDARFVGTHARFASSIGWLEVKKQIAEDEIPMHQGKTAYRPGFLFRVFQTLRNMSWRAWLFMPNFARLSTYKLLGKFGHETSSSGVRRLPFGLYLKGTTDHWARNELNALKLVSKHKSTPVPQGLDVVADTKNTYLLTRSLPGHTLLQAVDMFSDRDCDDFVDEMQGFVAQLREIPSTGSICNTLGQAISDLRIHSADLVGPFEDEVSFSQKLRYSNEATRRGHQVVFTHATLSPRTILIDRIIRPDGARGWEVSGITGWGASGFYPEYWNAQNHILRQYRSTFGDTVQSLHEGRAASMF